MLSRTNYPDADDPILPRLSARESGIDDARLDRMSKQLHALGMKSVVLLKGGALAWDWYDHGTDKPLSLYSCTKSVLSLLLGIANGQGLIGGVDDPAANWLHSLAGSTDDRKQSITIGHLLTMTSGLDWPDFDKPYWEMKRCSDWVGFASERPLLHAPGKVFCYNSGGSHLLSALLTEATGMSAMRYATQYLFTPLGIRRAAWSAKDGINEGGTGLHLYSRDLAKLGLLCLQRGIVDGVPIVPSVWLESTTAAAHKALSHYEPRIYGQYGGHWWVEEGDEASGPFYFAFGYGGQYLIVAPWLDAVAVIRKKPAGRNQAIVSRDLFHHVLVPALGKGTIRANSHLIH